MNAVFLTVHAKFLESGEDVDACHENRRRIGINELAQCVWRGLLVMVFVHPIICKIHCQLSSGHSLPSGKDHFHNCSCSSSPTHTGIPTDMSTCTCTAMEHSVGFNVLFS